VEFGLYEDLAPENVKSFYRNNYLLYAKKPGMSKIMKAESLKWHQNNMRKLYHTCEPDKIAIAMIRRVVLELKEEARTMRED
jgi:hypothetical protein